MWRTSHTRKPPEPRSAADKARFSTRYKYVVKPDDPAIADEEIDITCTGLSDSVFAPRVAIGGRISPVLSITRAPNLLGVNHVRVRVPRGIAPGRAVPVRLFHMDRPSNDVTIAVR